VRHLEVTTMSRRQRDKRLTVNQVMREMERAFEMFEQTTKETLHKEFGFGEQRWERFRDAFSREIEKKLIDVEKGMRRSVRR